MKFVVKITRGEPAFLMFLEVDQKVNEFRHLSAIGYICVVFEHTSH